MCKKKKFIVHFADSKHTVWAYHLEGACMEATDLEGQFEEMSECVEDSHGGKFTFEIDVTTNKIN